MTIDPLRFPPDLIEEAQKARQEAEAARERARSLNDHLSQLWSGKCDAKAVDSSQERLEAPARLRDSAVALQSASLAAVRDDEVVYRLIAEIGRDLMRGEGSERFGRRERLKPAGDDR